jgi:hypothetical protein
MVGILGTVAMLYTGLVVVPTTIQHASANDGGDTVSNSNKRTNVVTMQSVLTQPQ